MNVVATVNQIREGLGIEAEFLEGNRSHKFGAGLVRWIVKLLSRTVAPEVLGVEKDVVMTPIMHDSPGEIAQALDVKDWKKGEVEPVPAPQSSTRSPACTARSTSARRPR